MTLCRMNERNSLCVGVSWVFPNRQAWFHIEGLVFEVESCMLTGRGGMKVDEVHLGNTTSHAWQTLVPEVLVEKSLSSHFQRL